ncbi:MAG: hypothetical protein KDA84_07480, partial [Planctomycetaceae bacterium]|nr:hypothetical protein [Planctomycetaceae bacterium]
LPTDYHNSALSPVMGLSSLNWKPSTIASRVCRQMQQDLSDFPTELLDRLVKFPQRRIIAVRFVH